MKILINTEMTDRLKISKQTIKMCFWTERKKKWVAISKSTIFLPSQATLSKLAIK
jgi:hypothetical protein